MIIEKLTNIFLGGKSGTSVKLKIKINTLIETSLSKVYISAFSHRISLNHEQTWAKTARLPVLSIHTFSYLGAILKLMANVFKVNISTGKNTAIFLPNSFICRVRLSLVFSQFPLWFERNDHVYHKRLAHFKTAEFALAFSAVWKTRGSQLIYDRMCLKNDWWIISFVSAWQIFIF